MDALQHRVGVDLRGLGALAASLTATLAPWLEGQLPARPAPPPAHVVQPVRAGPPPTSVTAAPVSSFAVALHWAAPTGAKGVGYRICRWSVPPTACLAITSATLAGTSFTDGALIPDTTFSYSVVAVYPDGREGQSTPVAVRTPPAPAPRGLKADAVGSAGIQLTWRPVPGAFTYAISRNESPLTVFKNGVTMTAKGPLRGTAYLDDGLPPGSYSYKVRAIYRVSDWPTRGGATLGASLPAQVTGNTVIRGFADTHTHQFANLALGGLMFWGRPFGPIEQALAWCDFDSGSTLLNPKPVHGPGGTLDIVGSAALGPRLGHKVGGFPQFDGWPVWNTGNHQQMYSDWVYRAFQGGLRLMVMHAVNNELICGLVAKREGRTCSDMEAVDLQLAAAKDMESYIAQTQGGWYRIVDTPEEARQAIYAGKLAVVLGIEVDNLFDCRLNGSCSAQDVQSNLDRYYAAGVRHLFPIHFANNAFGGFALFNDIFNVNNQQLTGRFVDVRDCSQDGIRFQSGVIQDAYDLSRLLSVASFNLVKPPPSPFLGQCNAMGLGPLGTVLVTQMMQRGMIIDIDHMSELAGDATLAIAATVHYPGVIAGHTGFVETSKGGKRSEGQKTARQVAGIRAVGGMVSAIIHQGTTDEIAGWGTKVANDCSESSKAWAQAYLYAVDAMGGPAVAAVGLATDQLLNPMVAPRFGPDACGGNEAEAKAQADPATRRMVEYPVTPLVPGAPLGPAAAGQRVFDYNTDGLAHYGLLPDFIQDLQNVGLTRTDLDPLFRSAEAYIRMWEGAARWAGGTARPAPVTVAVKALGVTPDSETIEVYAFDTVRILLVTGVVKLDNVPKGPTNSPIRFVPAPVLGGYRVPTGSVVAGASNVPFDIPLPPPHRMKVSVAMTGAGDTGEVRVTALDAVTGRPVANAIVTLGNWKAHPLSQPILLAVACPTVTSDGEPGVSPTGKPRVPAVKGVNPCIAGGRVQAPGYAGASFVVRARRR